MKLKRRNFLAGSAAAVAVSGLPSSGFSSAPQLGTQVPGYYRFRVGAIEVTALLDGHLDLPSAAMLNVTEEQAVKYLAEDQDRVYDGHYRIPVSCFAINTGDKLVLVDTGSGPHLGSTQGHLPEIMKIAGLNAGDVDAVLMTHMHSDHCGGLMDATNGTPLFPNAELVMHATEQAYWLDDSNAEKLIPELRGMFPLAQASMAVYGDRVRTFDGEQDVVSGVRAVPLPGHTPGHTGFMVDSDNEQALIWGDICHIASLQLRNPEVAIVADVDILGAAEMRRAMLDRVSTDKTRVVGMHLDFPGVGRVERQGGAYRFVGAPRAYVL